MERSVLVTGGAGFIGSHLCEALLKRGHKVICVDDFNDYYDPRGKEDNVRVLLKHKKFVLRRIDIVDMKALLSVFKKERIGAIMHVAARAGVRPSIADPFIYTKTNVQGTINLLELARSFRVGKFIFASSSSVYGLGKVPFNEDKNAYDPISPYAATKVSGELLCKAYHHLYGIPTVCLRLFTVYGPRGRPDMAPYKFMKLILDGNQIPFYGEGGSKRDYTYVADIVSGFVAALEKDLKFEIINLGNSHPIKLGTLLNTIEKYTGKKARIRHLGEQPGDVPITYADISKARKILGWKPRTSLEEGIKAMVGWYLLK